MSDESLWDAMERLRLSTVAGVDRLEAGIADLQDQESKLGGEQE